MKGGGIEISKKLVVLNSASSVIKSILSLTVVFWIQRHLVRNVPEEEYLTASEQSELRLGRQVGK